MHLFFVMEIHSLFHYSSKEFKCIVFGQRHYCFITVSQSICDVTDTKYVRSFNVLYIFLAQTHCQQYKLKFKNFLQKFKHPSIKVPFRIYFYSRLFVFITTFNQPSSMLNKFCNSDMKKQPSPFPSHKKAKSIVRSSACDYESL